MSFALYLDEHVDVLLAFLLRQGGYDVLTTQEAANRGLPDEAQLAFATESGRAILTFDIKDFDPLVEYWTEQKRHHAGILVSRRRSPWELHQGVLTVFDWYPNGIADLYLRVPSLGGVR